MRYRKTLAAVVVAAMLAVGIPAQAEALVSLPAPTGPYRVGETTLHLIDRGRQDRELMVSLFYPAAVTRPGPAAPYMLDAAAAHFDAVTVNDYLGLGLPVGKVDWASIGTHATLNAPVDRRAGKLPVVLYSPGLGEPRTWSTTLVEQLAAAGYLVVTIDNTGESPEVEFPDGRLVLLSGAEPTVAWVSGMMATRVADTSFVLDQLGGVTAAGLRGRIDLDAVGMFGHSAGGFATAAAMAADPRIRAGINLDGTMGLDPLDPEVLSPVAQRGLDRPFLLVGSDGTGETITNDPSWTSFWAHSTGWKAALTLTGSRHASFTDAEVVLPQVAGPLRLDPATVRDDIGTLDPRLALRTLDRYLSGFFDRFLRHRGGGFLDDPEPVYPIARQQAR
ncbi:alpha/beta hydrolase family protein [Winogradskya humida]|nr:lipase [Actinoplanes humidus]